MTDKSNNKYKIAGLSIILLGAISTLPFISKNIIFAISEFLTCTGIGLILFSFSYKKKKEELKIPYIKKSKKKNYVKNIAKSINNYNREECINAIHDANILIPGEDISNDLQEIEYLTDEIFVFAQKDEDEDSLRKFFSYYLPTLFNLLNTYIEIDNKKIKTKQTEQIKEEIACGIKNIKYAFSNLYDRLISEKAMDVSSEISAMKDIINLDGLMENSVFNIDKKRKKF